jgi:hypothetical protein
MSVGSLVLLVSSTLLWFYSLSCHSCRHTVGGRLKHFSKHPIRYKIWSWVSVLNHSHQKFAWYSLFGVAFADIYVRLVATGALDQLLLLLRDEITDDSVSTTAYTYDVLVIGAGGAGSTCCRRSARSWS